MKKIPRAFLAIATMLTLVSLTATPALAARGQNAWTVLGSLHVKDRVERDVLHLEHRKGTFDKIRLKAVGSGVQFRSLKIHYENGSVQDVRLRSVIPAGKTSRVIDLKGGQRAIEKIVFVYDAQTLKIGRGAQVRVLGRR